MDRAACITFLFATTTAVAGCSPHNSTSPTAPASPAVVSLSLSSAPAAGGAIQVTAIGRSAEGTAQDVTRAAQWESSNTQLAAVTQTGLVTPVGKGDVAVRATYMGVSGSISLSVAPPVVTSLTISGAQPAGSFQLTATAKRADNSSVNVTPSAMWQSSDPHIALVSSIGYVTVVANGVVDVSATFEGVTATLHASVSVPKIYAITGVVTDAASGAPVAGVRVQAIGGPHGVTDAAGKYTLNGVAEGRTLVEFDADGYEVLERDVMVNGDATLSVALTAAHS